MQRVQQINVHTMQSKVRFAIIIIAGIVTLVRIKFGKMAEQSKLHHYYVVCIVALASIKI